MLAQNLLGAAPGSPVLRRTIDAVVDALTEVDDAGCAPSTLSKRDLAKNHSWTWLRTIWLTGPFAFTAAAHETAAAGDWPRAAVFEPKGPSACRSNKRVNAEMDSVSPKYQHLEPERPFLWRRVLEDGGGDEGKGG